MKIRFAQPHPLLSDYIERYWSWESENETPYNMPHVAPGTGVDFYFHYQQPFNVNYHGTLPVSHLIYSAKQSCKILPAGNIGFVAVRFRCAMFGNFAKMPLYELADSYADAEAIWKLKGKQLENQITETPTFEERIELLEIFFLQQLDACKKSVSVWKGVVDELYYKHEDVRLDQLAKELKITPRHFRRSFYDVSGMAPKRFQQLSRFKAVLKQLLINNDTNYLPIALEHGYFDQMHFIKEFKNFMGITPSSFLTANCFQSHFYYKSLR